MERLHTPVTNSSLAVSLKISCSCIPSICVITDFVYVKEKVRPPVFSADKCRDHSLVHNCGSKFSENPGGEQWVSLSHMVETSALFTGKLPLLPVWIIAAEVTEGDGAAWGLEHPLGLWESRSEVCRWGRAFLLSVPCIPSTSLSEPARLRQALQSTQPTRVSVSGEVQSFWGLPVRPTVSGKQRQSSLTMRVRLIFHPARSITGDEPAKSQEICRKPLGDLLQEESFPPVEVSDKAPDASQSSIVAHLKTSERIRTRCDSQSFSSGVIQIALHSRVELTLWKLCVK